ncbi:hypothetical protein [Roseibium limicola]|uniref:Uncharacterized protein n=1 Tax=Roseibium limicola TaxID=2816037 RepID=A0A939ES60_9HYPH|nr:hypothetical protein [Roseibium limicola]MBO0346129.1 hypothetical protein [Roseibium limicola]
MKLVTTGLLFLATAASMALFADLKTLEDSSSYSARSSISSNLNTSTSMMQASLLH